jgi:class 3 adenylate cyclase
VDAARRIVDRGAELGRLVGLITDAAVPLVSVIGAPGVGKTALVSVAAAQAPRRRHVTAVCLDADDQGAYEDQGVAVAAMTATELLDGSRRDAFADAEVIVLDCADAGTGPLAAALLGGAGPGTTTAEPAASTLVVVGRGPLRRRGERRLPVPPLAVPEPGAGATAPAVELLLRRAQAIRPDLQLTTETAPQLASIARLCGGIPLALELAARRLRVLGVDDMLLRLRDPMAVLSGGGSELPARHRSLARCLDASWELLDAQAASLAVRAALLDGDLTLDDLEETCRLADVNLDVLHAAEALVDAGWLVPAMTAGVYRMPWPWRTHAMARLDAGEETRLRRRLVPPLLEAGARRPVLGITVAARGALAGDPDSLRLAGLLPGEKPGRDVAEGTAVLTAFLTRLVEAAVAADASGDAPTAWIAALVAAWGAEQLRLPDVRDHMLAVHRHAITGTPAGDADSAADDAAGQGAMTLGPARRHGSRRVLATVLFASLHTLADPSSTDAQWLEVVRTHESLLRSLIAQHHGYAARVSGGGGAIALFDGPAAAVRCGRDLLEALHALGITARAGVHIGEVDILESDVSGLPVHIAARVAAKSGPGALLVTEVVRDAAAGSGIEFDALAPTQLKGVPGDWVLCTVAPRTAL